MNNMTEKEKMFNGLLYDPFSENMPEERKRAHELCLQYNMTNESDTNTRKKILDELMPKRGEGVYLQGPIQFDFGTHITMGKGSFANFNFVVLDENYVNIGENVFIGPNCSIYTPIHPLHPKDRNTFYNEKTQCYTNMEYSKGVEIKNDCWLGGNVTILPGVTIGEGCVIGAGSVVTKDIPPYSLAYGNPCKVIRKITDEDTINK